MEIPCEFRFSVRPAVTSLVGPVYLSGHTDQYSHFDLQTFVWAIVSGNHRAHFSASHANSYPQFCRCRCQRSTDLPDHVCPPLTCAMPFITLQSFNHRCACEGGWGCSPSYWLVLVELLLRRGFHSVMDRRCRWWGQPV